MNELPRLPAGVLAVRAGHGANCSSVGSLVDVLFLTSVASGALLVAVAAALGERGERGTVDAERDSERADVEVPPARSE